MPGLLVSVRSADEARSALAGGATVIDIKEPARGPLGRANADIWRDVVEAVGEAVPVSAALGEIADWRGLGAVEARTWRKLAYCKLGLAGAGEGWERAWSNVVTESRESPTAPPLPPLIKVGGQRGRKTPPATRHPPPATRFGLRSSTPIGGRPPRRGPTRFWTLRFGWAAGESWWIRGKSRGRAR
jgi:hypothetical protein